VTYHGETAHAHVHLTADEHGRIAQIHLVEAGQLSRLLAHYTYAAAGDLISATDEHGASRTYAYQHHLLTRYTDRTGRGMNLRWNGDSADAKAVREWADDGSYDTTLEWDPDIRLTYVTDAQGHETGYYYDILGYTYRIRHPDGLSEWFFRDAAKNVIRHLHPDGSADDYTYDERSNLRSHTRADGSTIHYAYDDQDNLLRIRDAEGGLWQRDYDQPGNLVEETDPLGNKTVYSNNPAGLPVAITDARGGTSQLTYNEAGQLTQYTDCSGKTSAWHYDDRGQLICFTDAAGGITQYRHEAGHLSAVQHADGGREQFEHDAEGRLLTHTDGLSRRTAWTYTAAGLIATRTGADGQHLGYRWDRTGRLVALTNENGRATTFAYDPVGRLLAETGFDGRTMAYHYAPSSGVLTHVQRGERFTALSFDEVGRLTGRRVGLRQSGDTTVRPGNDATRTHNATAQPDGTTTHPDDTAVHYTQQERFAYNGNGQLILAENEASRLQWFHDAAGNLTREHHHYPFLKEQRVAVWRHEYDVLNQRVTTIRPDGHRAGMLTYGSGHVHGVMLDDIELVQIERDSLHREITRVQGNGLTQVQQYDPVGRLTLQRIGAGRWQTPGGSGNPLLVQRDYRYDGAGQLEAIRDTHNGAHSYRYDPVGRLLAATSAPGEETFAFDPAGNLLDDTGTRHIEGNPAQNKQDYTSSIQGRPALLDNLLRDYAGTRYTWDEYGNLTQKQHNGGTTVYTWDGFDRLIQSRGARVTVTYRYDALGRRIMKESSAHVPFNPDAGSGWQELEQKRRNEAHGYGLTLYGWDGDTLAWESSAHGGGRTTHYVYEPGSFVPLAQATQAGPVKLHIQPVYGAHYDINEDPLWVQAQEPSAFTTIAYYQCDQLGTPQELTDTHGGIAWSAQYRAWGEAKQVISEAARKAGIHNPIRFQGQYADHETGLHYNRHRYYDPQTGRFISKDPVGLAGGINVFSYAVNPVEWIDPLGLSGDCPTMINPRRLKSRQGPSEMTGNKIKRYTSVMRAQDGYGAFPPIEAADVGDEEFIIIDGHHRAEAAIRAGLPKVPVNVSTVLPTQAVKLKDEADMAKAERTERCQY
jgi:RHS repeat-associated protein